MFWNKSKRIFLDYASATPVLPEVSKVMEKYWSKEFYNPNAIYEEGVVVKKHTEECRTRIARLVGVSANNIIFTASGTESDNMAILGVFEESFKTIKRPHFIISSIEHPAVVAAAAECVRRGAKVSTCQVDTFGIVDLKVLEKLINKDTVLVSVGFANHEIGTVQPISKIGRLVRKVRKEKGSEYPLLHTDASSAANFLPINLETLQADLMTLDASKIYGPKGIGALVVANGVKIHPIIFGGGQEGGQRSGTPNTALISGFATALEIVQRDKEKESKRLESYRKDFIDIVRENLPEAIINGSPDNHLPNIVSVSIPNTLSEFILLKLDKAGVMVSVGSACSLDERVSGSSIIRAIYLERSRGVARQDLAESTIRFSFGRFTTLEEIKKAVEIFVKVC